LHSKQVHDQSCAKQVPVFFRVNQYSFVHKHAPVTKVKNSTGKWPCVTDFVVYTTHRLKGQEYEYAYSPMDCETYINMFLSTLSHMNVFTYQ